MFRRQNATLASRALPTMFPPWQQQQLQQAPPQAAQWSSDQRLAGAIPVTSSYTSAYSRPSTMFVVGGFHATRPVLQQQQAVQGRNDWMCVCGYVNFATRAACNQCHRRKESDLSTPAPAVGQNASREVLRGDWFCPCGAHNFSRRSQCVSCGTPKAEVGSPSLGAQPARKVLPGDWICQCGSHNFRSRTACIGCGAAAQVVTRASPASPVDWTCRNCQTPNAAGTQACGLCGSPTTGTGAPSTIPTPLRTGDWSCPQCAFHNFASRQVCKSCNASKPEGLESGPVKSALISTPKPGDWQCQCGSQNFARRVTCFGCGKQRQ